MWEGEEANPGLAGWGAQMRLKGQETGGVWRPKTQLWRDGARARAGGQGPWEEGGVRG